MYGRSTAVHPRMIGARNPRLLSVTALETVSVNAIVASHKLHSRLSAPDGLFKQGVRKYQSEAMIEFARWNGLSMSTHRSRTPESTLSGRRLADLVAQRHELELEEMILSERGSHFTSAAAFVEGVFRARAR
jgi:hypothetical protein